MKNHTNLPFFWLGLSTWLGMSFLPGEVIINEFKANQDERGIVWRADDRPQLGTGWTWWEESHDDSQWTLGPLPAGVGRFDIRTDFGSDFLGNSPSLYLRKTFTASSGLASSTRSLILRVAFNDGFAAYLNGEEVARSHLGPPHGFTYADQPAASTRHEGVLPVDFNLGPANAYLQSGENLLALQVHNADLLGDLYADVLLYVDGDAPVFSEDFNSLSTASRTHSRDGNSVSNSASGTPTAGRWLAIADNPSSDSSWSNLEVVSETDEDTLRYTLSADGGGASLDMPSPSVDFDGQWVSGNVSVTDLANTTVRFRALVPPDLGLTLGVQAGDGSGSIADGLPALAEVTENALLGYWRFDENGGTNGANITSMANTYGLSTLKGTRRETPTYSTDVPGPMIYDPLTKTLRENQFSMNASGTDARLRIPNQPALNTEGFTLEFFIKLEGEPQNYETFAQRSTGSADHLSSTRTRWKIGFDHGTAATSFGKIRADFDTPGTPPLDYQRSIRGEHIYVDTPSGDGDPSHYADGDPSLQGNGVNDNDAWHHVALTFDTVTRVAQFYTDGVLGESTRLEGLYTHPDSVIDVGKFGDDYGLYIDEVRYTGRVLETREFLTVQTEPRWMSYETRLSALTNNEQVALLNHLNSNGLTEIRLLFHVDPDGLTSQPKLVVIDDFSISYNDASFSAYPLDKGDSWRLLPGLMEPSGGIFDRGAWHDPNGGTKFSDWIELRNTASSAVSLGGWTLTDDPTLPNQWTFPNGTVIPGNGLLLILADNVTNLTQPHFLHANFKLSGGGQYLGLFNEQGTLQFEISPSYPSQYAISSYGFSSDGSALGYLEFPTPGAPNLGPALSDRVDAPDFDNKGGFYNSAVTVTLTSNTPGASIRYTLDGTEPTLSNGLNYNGPITVNKAGNSSGTMIRARAFLSGMMPSKSKSHTYLIDQDSRLRTAPAVVLSTDLPRNVYAPHGLLAIQGGAYVNDDWVAVTGQDYNFPYQRGRAFEKPIHTEFYWPDGTAGFRSESGIRVAASNSARPELVLAHLDESPWVSHKTEKPSFNLYFREEYGNPSVGFPFNGPVEPVDQFEEFRIRAGKNDLDNPFIKDEWVRRLFKAMGHVSSTGLIHSLYLNGEFKGYYNTVERLRESFFNAHYDLPGSTDWDILQAGNPEELAEGDRTAWNAFVVALQQSTTLQNWNTVKAHADVVNMADYYLLNIYMAMWDWPTNNWVAAKPRLLDGRYRLYVWDAEGSIYQSNNKDVDYDTIATDLADGTAEVQVCWQGLMRWPEFRLLMADRIHHHFFNGGVLDDRDRNHSQIMTHWNALKNDFADLLDFVQAESIDERDLDRWLDPTDGRRHYLLGPQDQFFANHGLWPDTEPVVFSQHGGTVAGGYTLEMDHTGPGTITIYYTTDGSDPRSEGGNVSGSAQVYSSTTNVVLTAASTLVNARARNTSGEWSALTEATFIAGTVSPTAETLAVVEIHYHPADAKEAELLVSTDKDDYEFIQLRNLGNQALNLTGVLFDGTLEGIKFHFTGSAVTTLAPGAYVLVVKNHAAFQARYGNAFNSLIAGEYDGRLSNQGEQLTLRDASGASLHQFTYDDAEPWPSMADGLGRSLQMRQPDLDPTDPTSWYASPVYHGLPGGVPTPQSYSDWLTTHFNSAERADPNLTGPLADFDADGLTNLVEFGLGTLPRVFAPEEDFPMGTENTVSENGQTFLTTAYYLSSMATGITHQIEVSADQKAWESGTPHTLDVMAPLDDGQGRRTYQVRDTKSLETSDRRFIRLRFILE